MAKEIERKFIVTDDSYKALSHSHCHICQGYLSRRPEATVRVRIKDKDAFITIKGITVGCTRDEWEYRIPVSDALTLLGLCDDRIIDKTRWLVNHEGHTWEIDEFAGRLTGLTVAEIELETGDEQFDFPPFIGREVTGDAAYYNSNL